MNEHQKLAIQALENMRGDDLCRARIAFKDLTPAQMDKPYMYSWKTRREILAEYEAHDAKINAAIEWVKEQKPCASSN